MDIDLSKENVCINKLVCEKKEIFFVEEDMIVPDSKPDILNAINISGNVCIYKKEIMDGKIKIEGSVNTYVMYLPDSKEENLRGLNATLDFSQNIQIPECREGMDLEICVSIKDLECKVINGRKINIKAGLEAKAQIYSNEDIEIVNGINNIEDVQLLEEKFTINSLLGKNSTRIYVKDTLNIDSQDEVAEILKVDVKLTDSDIKISYNKVLSKCEVNVKIMYLTSNGRINSVIGKIPAVGFIDIQDISEEDICDINNEINNIIIRPNSADEHSIYVEIEVDTSCTAFIKKEISLIQDIYSPTQNISFEQRKITTTIGKITKNRSFTVTSKTNMPDLVEGILIDTEVSVKLNKEQITNSRIIDEGELIVNFIFNNNSGSVNSKISKIPFECSMENPMESENVNVRTLMNVVNKKFDIKPNGDVDCNIDIEASYDFTKNVSMNIIDNIDMQENLSNANEYDSLRIYIVQKGDTLWNIAKKFRSTIEDIAKVNGIEDVDKIDIGQKLYIPKFRYHTKSNLKVS